MQSASHRLAHQIRLAVAATRWFVWGAALTPSVAAGQQQGGPPPATDIGHHDAVAIVREAKVLAGDAHITVSRQAVNIAVVKVETNSGTFVLAGDSALIATWADSSEALPELPPSAIRDHHAKLKSWRVRAQDDTLTTMQFTRVAAKDGSNIELSLSNGAWGTFELLGAESQQVFAALRGSGLDTTDTAHVKLTSRPANDRPCAAIIEPVPRSIPDTGCTTPHLEKQASAVPHTSVPMYPEALMEARKEGTVYVEFIIDTTGKADKRTIRLLSATYPQFGLAVWYGLGHMQFNPAEVDGRKVKELVQVPFAFALRRPE